MLGNSVSIIIIITVKFEENVSLSNIRVNSGCALFRRRVLHNYDDANLHWRYDIQFYWFL